MRVVFFSFIIALFAAIAPAQASAPKVKITIDISKQEMKVNYGLFSNHTWDVSTARRGFRTPIGKFKPTRMYEKYFSKKYYNSPMPNSIFFYHGYAIHGTTSIKQLGRPASHGCIRLHPKNAKKLFEIVKRYGRANTEIKIVH